MARKKKTKQLLRVWHIPQVPGEAFRLDVPSIDVAMPVLNALAAYDLFQLKHNIKPDFANAQGLEVLEGGEWVEWMDDDGDDISAYRYAKS